jgi:peptidoglycan/xylan/chitin deacetylase (PgdA/CDA1 family)
MDSGATIDPSGERRLWPLPFAALILFSVFARLPARADTIVSLTFDDNTSGHATAAQILNQYGMKGTFYVNSARIGTSSAYLTLNQLRSIAASGHEIAGHTLNHLNLTQQSAAEARRQVCDDRAQLQAWGFNPVSFAYPFGAFNGSVQDIVEDCGFDARGARRPSR